MSKVVVLWESNSGGYYRLNAEDWEALRAAGWAVNPEEREAFLPVDNYEEAEVSFAKATDRSVEEGCDCCGPAFQFGIWDVDQLDADDIKLIEEAQNVL